MKQWGVILMLAILFTSCQFTNQSIENTDETKISIDISNTTESDPNLLYERSEDISLIAKLTGHSDKVWSLAAGEHGTFVSGGKDSNLIVWDVETLQQKAINSDHNQPIIDVLILQNGDILSISDDNTIRKLNNQDYTSEVIYQDRISRFVINETETMMAILNADNEITIYSYPDFSEIANIQINNGCFEMIFDPQSDYLYVVGHEGKVQKWSAAKGELLQEYEGLSEDVHCIDITSDGKYIVAGAIDKLVMVWNEKTGEIISRYYHQDGLYDIDISEDDKMIASVGADKKVVLAELETGNVLARLRHDDEIQTVAFDPNGQLIIAGGYDSDIYVWGIEGFDTDVLPEITLKNAENVDELYNIHAHDRVVFDLDISSDGRLIASAGRDNMVYIWDIETGKAIRTLEVENNIVFMKLTNDNNYFVGKCENGNLIIWDLVKDEVIFESANIDEDISGFDLSKDERVMVTGGWHGEVILWDFETLQPIREQSYADFPILNVKFSPDDSKIFYTYAGQTEDFSVFAIETESFKPLYQLEGHEGYVYQADFSGKRSIIVTASADSQIMVWKIKNGKLTNTLDDHTQKVMDVDFSGDENVLVSGSAHDLTIRLWDIQDGEQIKVFRPGDEVQCVEFANSGKFFVSSGEDGILRIWGVEK